MKTAFTIALTAAAANATGLRSRDEPKKGSVGRKLNVHDTTLIETWASKYKCHEAGASLES